MTTPDRLGPGQVLSPVRRGCVRPPAWPAAETIRSCGQGFPDSRLAEAAGLEETPGRRHQPVGRCPARPSGRRRTSGRR